VVFRADASIAVGMGHAMRGLALAQALADERGGRSAFLMAAPPPAFAARADREAARVVALRAVPGGAADAAETLALARSHGAGWVVVDGYHLGEDYQRALVEGGMRVLALDDHGHLGRYHADLVLNQNLGAEAVAYGDRAPRTRLLLGPRHALLRREFRVFEPSPRATPATARRILVTLGGSDPDDVSARVVDALAGIDLPLQVQVLIGAANPHRASLERAAAASPHPVELVADAVDMSQRMAAADLAVAAAGGTSWELARVGTPQVAIVLADNQRPAGRALGERGLAVNAGWHADATADDLARAVGAVVRDPGRRAELSRRGPELVDGRGALRVLAAMGLAASGAAAA
jgi:UDP-2,4-diacetamido-2,4,6-trideoxy-beta-L-altropyranose hydrolase